MSRHQSRPIRRGLPTLSTQATAVVSVAMVLLILGIVSLLAVAARSIGSEVRSAVGYVALVRESASPDEKESLRQLLESAPSTSSASYASPDEVLQRWQTLQPADSSASDIISIIGINPFTAEWEVKVKEQTWWSGPGRTSWTR